MTRKKEVCPATGIRRRQMIWRCAVVTTLIASAAVPALAASGMLISDNTPD
ncbi:MAG TPA: hypothetical protein VIX14_16085 [Terriglobales bacterium]